MNWIKSGLLGILSMVFFSAIGQEPGRVEILLDSTSAFSISNLPASGWSSVGLREEIAFGYNKNSAVWLKIYIAEKSWTNDNYLSFENNHLDSIELFSDGKRIGILGDRTSSLSEYVSHPVFQLASLKSEDFVLARVKKTLSFIDFSVDIKSKSTLQSASNQKIALSFLYIGITLLLTLINIFIWRNKREKKFLYYIIYSLIGLIYVLVNLGVARYLFGSEFLFFSEVRIYAGSFWFLFLILFIVELLRFKRTQPFIYRVLFSINAGGVVLAVLGGVLLLSKKFDWIWIPSFASYSFFLIAVVFLSIGIGKSLLSKSQMAIYVLLSFLPHVLWALSIIFTAFNLIDLGFKIDWLVFIMLYEMSLFGWILFSDYIEAYKRSNELQLVVIENERNMIEISEKIRLKERRQLSNLLHDKLSADIATTMHLIANKRNEDALDALGDIAFGMRELSHTILPFSLQDGALGEAVQSQVKIVQRTSRNFKLEFWSYDFPAFIDQDLAFTMYLISMELIQNALKHSHGSLMKIDFFGYPNELVFTFSDDGLGFDVDSNKGFGLTSIEGRIRDKGGKITIDSGKDIGTSIVIQIPR